MRLLLTGLLALLPCLAFAGEPEIRAALERQIPGAQVDALKPTPLKGLWQYRIGSQVGYITEQGGYLLVGDLIDTKAQVNLTQRARAQWRAEKIRAVPQSTRIVFPATPGTTPVGTVTVFTDPSCGFCRKFHQDMAAYNALGITVEYLAFPRAGVASADGRTLQSVWCARDKQQALTEAKQGVELPNRTCAHPVTRHYDLARELGLSGTPAVIDANGNELGGYVEPAQLARLLSNTAPAGSR